MLLTLIILSWYLIGVLSFILIECIVRDYSIDIRQIKMAFKYGYSGFAMFIVLMVFFIIWMGEKELHK